MATKTQEQIRVEKLINKLERKNREKYLGLVRRMKNGVDLKNIAELLERGRVDDALSYIDSAVIPLGSIVADTAFVAGAEEMAVLARRHLDQTQWGISFDPTDPEAARVVRNSKLSLIRQFTDEQRAATRRAVEEALLAGESAIQAAREFRDSVGLLPKQQRAVNNYRKALEKAHTAPMGAMENALRDRRYDKAIEAANALNRPLTKKQIDKMVNRYRERQIKHRAERIARTETTRGVSQGRELALRQTLRTGNIPAGWVERTWRAVQDSRTRDSHGSMSGQKRPLGVPFTSGNGYSLQYPGDPGAPASETIHCRCVVTTRIKRPKGSLRNAIDNLGPPPL